MKVSGGGFQEPLGFGVDEGSRPAVNFMGECGDGRSHLSHGSTARLERVTAYFVAPDATEDTEVTLRAYPMVSTREWYALAETVTVRAASASAAPPPVPVAPPPAPAAAAAAATATAATPL